MICNAGTLAVFTEEIYQPAHIALRPRSFAELRRVARQFEAFAGPVLLTDISEDVLTAFLGHLLARGLSGPTINSARRELLTLLRFAYRRHLIDEVPRDVPRVPESRRIPTAWTTEEVARLFDLSSRWPGRVGNHLARLWWPALEKVAYWTGARIGDLMAIRPADLDVTRAELLVCASKTGKEKLYSLHPQAMTAMASVYNPRAERLFVWPYSPNHLFVVFRGIVRAAGVPYNGKRGQLFQRLRRTHVTYCWLRSPALAQRQADHYSARTTWQSYVDPRIAGEQTAADVLPVPMV